jgi:hypothetical protein
MTVDNSTTKSATTTEAVQLPAESDRSQALKQLSEAFAKTTSAIADIRFANIKRPTLDLKSPSQDCIDTIQPTGETKMDLFINRIKQNKVLLIKVAAGVIGAAIGVAVVVVVIRNAEDLEAEANLLDAPDMSVVEE